MVGSVGNNYNNYYSQDIINSGQKTNKTENTEFALSASDKKCEYFNMAKDGVVNYNGVTFNCDYKHNAITLGDVDTNPRKVLTIGLSGGGESYDPCTTGPHLHFAIQNSSGNYVDPRDYVNFPKKGSRFSGRY